MRGLRTTLRIVVGSPTGLLAVVLFVFFLVLAIVGPSIWGDAGAEIDSSSAYSAPFTDGVLGTDGLGRDVLARTLAATRISLLLAVLATALAALIGIGAGAAVGVLGPRLRKQLTAVIAFGLTLPGILVALFVVTITGPGAVGATVAIGLAMAPFFARTAQTLAASVAESEYLAAARVLGLSRRRLLRKHILPNTAEPLLLQAGAGATLALVLISALSFLGLGVQAPSYDWGRVLSDGLEALYIAPAAALTPGVAIVLAGLMFTFLGEALARSLNPAIRLGDNRSRRAAGAKGGPAGAAAPTPAENGGPGATTVGADGDATILVEDLRVSFDQGEGSQVAVNGVSFAIGRGEIVGLVGESGSGKSMTALALAGLSPATSDVSAERIVFAGVDLQRASRRERRRLLGRGLAVIFQDPMSSLNPALRVGRQLTEKVEVHDGMGRGPALTLAERRLTEAHVPAADRRLRQYPHEYSGGMRQRAMIAMGLMTDPTLIVADEPTTALDVTVQAQILDLLREANQERGAAVLFISHDMAVVSELCARVLVMYAGRIVEILDVEDLAKPAHPYTQALMGTVVGLDANRSEPLTTIAGAPPKAGQATRGCPFAPRCPEASERCGEEDPALVRFGGAEHAVACWARQPEGAVAVGRGEA